MAQNSANTAFDLTWNAVWESKVTIRNDGWVAEMKIPFSAIRISKSQIQDWGINFARFTRKDNETSLWSPEDPNINGDINQWGTWNWAKRYQTTFKAFFSTVYFRRVQNFAYY
ncbi:MAG: hypothetical protein WDM90_13425 [Ferruginibacter sp.]